MTSHYRELSRVKDYHNYLDFCRVEIFTNTRPTPAKRCTFAIHLSHALQCVKSSLVCATVCIVFQYNPKYYASISELFRISTEKLNRGNGELRREKNVCSEGPNNATPDTAKAEQCCSSEPATSSHQQTSQSTTFTPRLTPLASAISDFTDCKTSYKPLPHSYKRRRMAGLQLSHSLWFLLRVCAELIDIEVADLYSSLLIVEAGMLKDGAAVSQIEKAEQQLCDSATQTHPSPATVLE